LSILVKEKNNKTLNKNVFATPCGYLTLRGYGNYLARPKRLQNPAIYDIKNTGNPESSLFLLTGNVKIYSFTNIR
jgi:hypothetical protein